MNEINGMANEYNFNLNSSLQRDELFKYIKVRTSRESVSKNCLQIYSVSGFNIALGKRIRDFVNSRGWDQLGVRFLGTGICQAGNYTSNYISCIEISHENARPIIDDLYSHRELSIDDKITLNNLLGELEKSVNIAKLQKNEISKGPKKILKDFVRLYIEDIIPVVPNVKDAIKLLKQVSHYLLWVNSSNVNLEIFKNNFLHNNNLDDSFCDCLLTLGRIMTSRAEMETTYQRFGDDNKIPSNKKVNEFIETCIRKEYLKNDMKNIISGIIEQSMEPK